MAPHAIDQGAGEPRICGRGQPGGERLAPICRLAEAGAIERSRHRPCEGLVLRLVGLAEEEGPARIGELDAPDAPLGLVLERKRPHAGEHRRQLAKIFLLPFLRRVIVALRALDLHAQEQARHLAREIAAVLRIVEQPVDGSIDLGFLDAAGRRARRQDLELAAARVHPARGDQLGRELAPGQVAFEPAAQPLPEGGAIHLRAGKAAAEQELLPIVGEVGGISRALEQPIDGASALVGGAVGQEGGHHLGRRNGSGEVEVDAPQKAGIIHPRCGPHVRPIPSCLDPVVDEAGRQGRRLAARARGAEASPAHQPGGEPARGQETLHYKRV